MEDTIREVIMVNIDDNSYFTLVLPLQTATCLNDKQLYTVHFTMLSCKSSKKMHLNAPLPAKDCSIFQRGSLSHLHGKGHPHSVLDLSLPVDLTHLQSQQSASAPSYWTGLIHPCTPQLGSTVLESRLTDFILWRANALWVQIYNSFETVVNIYKLKVNNDWARINVYTKRQYAEKKNGYMRKMSKNDIGEFVWLERMQTVQKVMRSDMGIQKNRPL